MSTNLRNYTTALQGFDAVIQQVSPDQWDAPSPCEGWCARDVVAHAAGVIDAVADMARTGQVAMPGTPDPGDDPVGLWNASLSGVLEALGQPGALDQVGEFWFGESSIDDIVAFAVWDPLGHSWDLATAVGLDANANEEVAEAAFAVISANADTLRGMKLMGDPVAVPADARPMNRFLGLTGRDPFA